MLHRTVHPQDDPEIKKRIEKNEITSCFSTTQFSSSSTSVNHPSHYKEGNLEVIDVIYNFSNLKNSFALGNVIKYILRAGHKDPNKFIEDLRKAKWYLDFEIEKLEEEKKIKNTEENF